MFPVRRSAVWFTAAVQPTVPFPVPLAPEEIVSQLASLAAFRVQAEFVAVTVIVPTSPADRTLAKVGPSVKLQAAPWVTENVADPIVIVPVREVVSGFDCTL